jgi:RAD51-like protein 2
MDPNDNRDESSKRKDRLDHFAQELGCSPSKAADIAHELDDALNSVGLPKINAKTQAFCGPTAASILSRRRVIPGKENVIATRQIVSFCQPIDRLLGGGLPLSELTEIVGLPGSGKTQLAMQLCVDARLPARQGGVEGCAVVIDSEGSWGGAGAERLHNMAGALVDHVALNVRRRADAKRAREMEMGAPDPSTEEPLLPEWFTPESIMEGIHIFRVHDEAAQTATTYSLPRFLMEQEEKGIPVKIIVIDSLAFHYRATASANRIGRNKNNSVAHTYNLTRMATFLSQLASEFEVAVLVMNHMTTRLDRSSGNMKIVPALGESWAHSVTSRILIDFYRRVGKDVVEGMEEARTCTLVKSPHKPPGTALFIITEKGIRGAPKPMLELQEQKRQRLDDA